MDMGRFLVEAHLREGRTVADGCGPRGARWAAAQRSVSHRLVTPRDVPRLSAFYGVVVYMYWRDHGPPHFHAEYGDREALFAIRDGHVYAGSLPPRAVRLVRAWRLLHLDELQQAWELASRHEQPGTIEPLP